MCVAGWLQLTLAQGACTTTGVAATRGFLDYTQDLYRWRPRLLDVAEEGDSPSQQQQQGLDGTAGPGKRLLNALVLFATVGQL